ncbi:M20 family metallo-hydrolase [candidate division KSB1 bacterium]|nr:M20 family metallo-hydrolase [candidate division KSB1 bacterium]
MSNELFERVAKRIDSYSDQMIKIQTELTALPALGPENGGEGEAKKADYVKDWLKNLKVDELIEVNAPDNRVPAGIRPNLLVMVKGKSQAKTIWLMSHLDIVPPGDAGLWDTDPYKVVVKDGKLYGRGVEDNQQGLVASLFAIKALQDEKLVQAYDVGLAIVADEETGSHKGLGYVLEQRPQLFRKEDLIIIPDAGNGDGTMIEVAEKSIYWMKFQVIGKQCHGSTPEAGINAHKAGAHLIVKLNRLYELYNATDPVFEPPISTFEPTQKTANVPNVNTIPGEDVFYFDCRILPKYDLKDVEKTVRKMADEIEQQFKVKINISSPQREQAAPATPVDALVVKALEKAILAVHKKQPKSVGIGGGTVAAFFRRAGLDAAVWATLDELAHQPNEYCVLDNLIKDTKVFANIFLQA